MELIFFAGTFVYLYFSVILDVFVIKRRQYSIFHITLIGIPIFIECFGL